MHNRKLYKLSERPLQVYGKCISNTMSIYKWLSLVKSDYVLSLRLGSNNAFIYIELQS